MRIATWNLERPKRNSHAKNQACVSKLQEVNADLWFLTETNEAICLPGYSVHSAPPVVNYHRPGETFTSILSRWPIVQSIPTWNPSLSACAEIESPFGPMLAYGTIITYANDRGPSRSSPRWHEHRASIKKHRDEWAALRHKYPSHCLIVAGDFNQSRDGSGWYEDPESIALLTEALSVSDLVCLTQENLRQSIGLSRATIDHIAVTEPLAHRRHTVGAWEGTLSGRRLSDHNGIFVDMHA